MDFGIHILKTTAQHNSDLSNFWAMIFFEGFT